MAGRVRLRVSEILSRHELEPLDEALTCELDRIVECARRELS